MQVGWLFQEDLIDCYRRPASPPLPPIWVTPPRLESRMAGIEVRRSYPGDKEEEILLS